MSRLDVVLFGASGFTGKLVTKALARLAARRGLTWAVAGRSQEKLHQVLKEVSQSTGLDLSSTPVLVADAQDELALRSVCVRARVLANCCGPYTLYGEAVVSACISSGTHYVDVTAEPPFIQLMQLKYDEAARAAGVYVVTACAFESIPGDLGVIFVQQNFKGVLNSVEAYLSSNAHNGSYNYGTWKSTIYCMSRFNELAAIKKKLHSTPAPNLTPKLKSRFLLHKRFEGWSFPYIGNTSSAVSRTQRYFHTRDGTRPVQIQTYVKVSTLWCALISMLGLIYVYLMSQFEVTRQILLNNWKTFSMGLIAKEPSEKATKDVVIACDLYCYGWDKSVEHRVDTLPPNKIVVARVSGANAGYDLSAMGLLYSAVAILEEPHNMPPEGGVLTPGMAFAKTNLVKNLQDNGVNFEIIHTKIHHD